MSKSAKPMEPERQQWVLDPRSPTGFRLDNLPDPPSQPATIFDGDKFAQQFDVERRHVNTEQEWRLNAQQDWPPQKGPPDPAPPIYICRLDGMAPPEEPDPWRISLPPFPEFSVKDREGITRYELHMICVGSEPYASWWRPTYETPAGRMSLTDELTPGSERNLNRDIRDGIIRPLVLGHDKHGTRAGDDAGKPDQDMKTDEGQEYWRGRGYLDPRDDGYSGHDVRDLTRRAA